MAPTRKNTEAKRLSRQAVTGQLGVNLVEQVVLAMGCGWHPTNQSLEVGIDGEIELVQPETREATNSIVRVQVKSTLGRWPAETDVAFDYTIEARDLIYWLGGNTPVILVVTRPQSKEAYWVDVKRYFSALTPNRPHKVRFDKRTMAFTPEVLPHLFTIARPKTMGLYFAPPPKQETLFTNLLRVTRLPERLWFGDTILKPGKEAFKSLRDHGLSEVEEFAIDGRRVLTPHDLRDPRWGRLVELGTVEDFPSSDWANSSDADQRRLFVQLLNRCLCARAWQLGIARRKQDGALYFKATDDLRPREVPFRSVKEQAVRTVFKGYPYTKGERLGQIAYYRHAAFYPQFRHYDANWFLEILPTYHFTSDGRRPHPAGHQYVARIKTLERQGPVMYQLVMWASILRGSEEVDAEFFSSKTYPFLGFGPLQTLTLDVGIDDKTWLPNEDKNTEKEGEITMGELPLFEVIDPYAPDAAIEDGAV